MIYSVLFPFTNNMTGHSISSSCSVIHEDCFIISCNMVLTSEFYVVPALYISFSGSVSYVY
jgi:hypothetical protein